MWIEKLKNLAKKRGITIKDLTAQIEMSEANLYKNFKRNSIETKNLEKIANVLGVPLNYFFDEGDSQKNINLNGTQNVGNNNGNSNSSTEFEACKKELTLVKEILKGKEEIIELLKKDKK